MSWEVSSMQSKRSFFNGTLFRKNLSRFWPLWGGVSLVGSLMPLYVLLALLSGRLDVLQDSFEFSRLLYQMVTTVVPAFTMGYAILCAMVVWGYLYSSRSVGLMHTLPVDRTCLFVTGTASGLAMMLIPYVVVGGMACLIALAWGAFSLTAVAQTAAAVILLSLQFFGFATLCAMLTGNIFALPAVYLLFNFLAPLTEALVFNLAQSFQVGLIQNDGGLSDFLAPLFQIYGSFFCEADYSLDTVRLFGLGTVAAYGLVGVAMLACAWALYRGRKSESAGDVVSFRGLRPVFRYGLALFSSLTLGWLLYELWASLFQKGDYADVLPMAVCMALTGVLGYYVASMLLEKSLRVFRGSWRGVALVCAASLAICLCVSLDLFGAERRVPDLGEVERVSVWDYRSDLELDLSAAENPELVERILALHRAITEDLDYIREESPFTGGTSEAVEEEDGLRQVKTWCALDITYQLKNGGTLRRRYDFSVSSRRAEDGSTYDALLAELYRDPAAIRERIAAPAGGQVVDIYLNGYGVEDSELSAADEELIYQALLRDADEGNIPAYDLFVSESAYDIRMDIEYRVRNVDGVDGHSWKSMPLYPSMIHTVQALLNAGAVAPEALAEKTGEAGMSIPADTAAPVPVTP